MFKKSFKAQVWFTVLRASLILLAVVPCMMEWTRIGELEERVVAARLSTYYQKSESRPDHIFVCVALLALEKTHPVGRFPWMVFDQSLARQISIKNHGMKNQSENVGRSILVCHQLCFRTRRETLSEVLLDFFGNSSHSEMLLVQWENSGTSAVPGVLLATSPPTCSGGSFTSCALAHCQY